MAKRESKLATKIDINMTPMIDVVFQLLTFFMLTLKSVVVEGDFNIRMPLGASAGVAEENPIPPLVIKMKASPEGRLVAVTINETPAVGKETIDALASADAMMEQAMAMPEGKERGKQFAQARQAIEAASVPFVDSLRARVVGTFGGNLGLAEQTELELDCDPALKYHHVVNAITAASGKPEGQEVIPLIQKIKFSPPRKQR